MTSSAPNEPTASPLGRYDDASPDGEQLHEVRLLKLPVRLLAASRAHHDELMHEFSMLAVGDRPARGSVPKRLLDLIQTLGVRYGTTGERPDAEVDAAIVRGDDTVDLTYHVPGHIVATADALAALLAEADDFCRAEQMLTLARTPLELRFADWYLDEFRRQVNGEPPRPWDGPLDL